MRYVAEYGQVIFPDVVLSKLALHPQQQFTLEALAAQAQAPPATDFQSRFMQH